MFLAERLLDVVKREPVEIRRALIPFHRVGIGDLLKRWHVRHARHRHQIAGRRVVAESQKRERAGRPATSGDQGGKRRVGQAVELAGGHVALAGRVVVDRIVEPIEREQLVAELGEELFVAHAALGMLLDRGKLVGAFGEDVAVLVEAIDLVDAFWIHQVSRVPPARGIEDDEEGAGVRLVVVLFSLRFGQAYGHSQTEAGKAAKLQKIASVMHDSPSVSAGRESPGTAVSGLFIPYSYRNSARRSRYVTTARQAR